MASKVARKNIIDRIEQRRGRFALTFVVLFTVTFGFLSIVGATPDATPGDTPATNESIVGASTSSPPAGAPEKPVRIAAPKIGLNATVVNPDTTDVDSLDQELTKGAVRYPTSALLGQDGTVLIFGHSSYLPVIIHQYYKTFDGIQNLKPGDTVSVYSADREYRYSVTGVRVADATDQNDNVIELPNDAPHLTLVTCDSFATKSNRYVVTADFVGAYSLAN